MKKLYIPCLILLSMMSISVVAGDCCPKDCTPESSCDVEYTSKSYFSVRPQFQSASPEMVSGFRADRLHAREDGWHGAIQAVVFGGKSSNPDDLTRYFFPNGKMMLYTDSRVGSGLGLPAAQPQLKPQDLLAQNFGIVPGGSAPFRSVIWIKPEQSVVGLGLHQRQSFGRNDAKDRGWWYSYSFPIMKVTNHLNFNEEVISQAVPAITTGLPLINNMTEAFQQDAWDFGKIYDCGSFSKTGVADIEVKLGYEWLQHDPYHLETYLGIVIPTGNKPSAQYIFEPIVGNGRHWGVMGGNAIGFQLFKDESKDRSLRVEYANYTQFLFRNIQCRSVDLVNKPWSRYIELYRDQDQAIAASNFASATERANYHTPGINLLTMPLKVRPGFSNNMTGSLLYTSKGFQAEGGYNLYCRQSECLKFACPWQEGPAIKHHDGNGTTNPIRDITGNFRLETIDETAAANLLRVSDYTFNLIEASDLDLVSASAPCLITHTVYGALGYRFDERKFPLFLNAGGSYEFARSSAGLDRWLIWAKIGFSY